MQNNDISEDILKEMKQQTEILKEIKETQDLIKSELLRKLEMRKNSHLNLFYLLYKNYRLQEKLLICRYELERTMNVIDKAVKKGFKIIN